MQKINEGPKLTQRQQEILQLIQSHIAAMGSPPTRAEIAKQMGFRSPNAAEDHLRALARKGVIELVSSTSRGIRLTNQMLAIPMIKLSARYPKALLSPEYIEGTYSLDPRFFKAPVDFLVLVSEENPRAPGLLPGDYLAISQRLDLGQYPRVLVRHDQHLQIESFFEASHLQDADHTRILEGRVVGIIRDLDHLILAS